MKRLAFGVALALNFGAALAAEPQKAAAAAPLKVLMIGNSFSEQMVNWLPPVAADLGRSVDVCSLYIGGCSLERHWKNVTEAASETPYVVTRSVAGKRQKDGRGNVAAFLKAEKWDVVTVQQASHFSWVPETFAPFGDDLVKYVREHAPQAKILVQETWSYTPFDGRLKAWKMTPAEMYAKLRKTYGDFARRNGLGVIPTGTAVQLVRDELPVKYAENSLGGDVVGSCTFVERNGKWSPQGDVFHMGPSGNYLQALVWAAKLFGADVTKGAYRPEGMSEERAAFLRKMAMKAVRQSEEPSVRVASPDGKNVISLWVSPLAYSVERGGAEVVAKTEIGMKIDGVCLAREAAGRAPKVTRGVRSGTVDMPVYKKSKIDLAAREAFADFGDWGVRLVARDDGVAYRFETKKPGRIRVECEKAAVNVPDAALRSGFCQTGSFGGEESVPTVGTVGDIPAAGRGMVYLPLVYTLADDTTVAVTDADVRDYPAWYLRRSPAAVGVRLDSVFAGWPKKTHRAGGWDIGKPIPSGGRWVVVDEHEGYLVETDGVRAFPWRAFVLGDAPKALCESDLVSALSAQQAKYDFSWVKPGKVAWDWWNAFDNQGDEGCNTKTYERFIDFAAKTGVEYVIFDEGWSETLNIWKFHKNVDVEHLIGYANKKGVGIILWMAWAQVYGDEERVAAHFAKLGAKGFKVDFMDRGDAEVERFLWKFADACARNRMVVDYHGAHRPTGMSRAYPNVLNYEGVHGLEQMKFFRGQDMMQNDVSAFFLRMTAGPMDYTPGAMDNYPVGGYPKQTATFNPSVNPGSEGTRCRQMAMMALYEAPLQMLCDSPTKYGKNMECFSFMAATPVVWADTVGLGGCPRKFAAVARQAKDGAWYAAAINSKDARDFELDTSFLGEGKWTAEVFRDAADADVAPTHYVHERGVAVKAGEKRTFRMAKGGGFVVKFVK